MYSPKSSNWTRSTLNRIQYISLSCFCKGDMWIDKFEESLRPRVSAALVVGGGRRGEWEWGTTNDGLRSSDQMENRRGRGMGGGGKLIVGGGGVSIAEGPASEGPDANHLAGASH